MSQDPSGEPTIVLRIRRQDRPDASHRWEEFAVQRRPNMNIIACLQYIAAHPITLDGQPTAPVVYDSDCLEEVCGACTMLINGQTRQACSALVDRLEPTYNRQIKDRDNSVYNPVDYGAHPPLREHQGHPALQRVDRRRVANEQLRKELTPCRSKNQNREDS